MQIPKPVDVTFVGFFVPIALIGLAVIVVLFRIRSRHLEFLKKLVSALAGSIGLMIWLLAVSGALNRRGVFLPERAGLIKWVLGPAGLATYGASMYWLYLYYVRKVTPKIEQLEQRALAAGAVAGIAVWLLSGGLD